MSLWLTACALIAPAGGIPGLWSERIDKASLMSPSRVVLGGLLGERASLNIENRLMKVDEDELLGGYRSRPGSHPWIGEHVGKFLHAASIASLSSGGGALKAKAERVAKGLMASQEADGYLGTYEAGSRFSLKPDREWDVWSHKYNLIGLLAWHDVSHDPSALSACRRMADLLIRTFAPGEKLFCQTSAHEGMASTSVLEPIVSLYQETKDKRYLAFAKQIVESFEEPEGSHLISDILQTKSVANASNGKAYEMLSNLVGLVDLYRVTGEPRYLTPAKLAWQDIAANRIYLTGAGSCREHWTQDGFMPIEDDDNVGENCVSVTWIQFNLALYKLEGDSKYLDEAEKTLYNHLLGSQRPDGAAWCYYAPLNGARHFGTATNCCLSSGPRALALLPSFAFGQRPEGLDINLYGDAQLQGELSLEMKSGYPNDGRAEVRITKAPSSQKTIRLRIPAWAKPVSVKLNGGSLGFGNPGSWFEAKRRWKKGDSLSLEFSMPLKRIEGQGKQKNHAAFVKGPIVYAALLPTPDDEGPRLHAGTKGGSPKPLSGQRFSLKGFLQADQYGLKGGREPMGQDLILEPYYLAGKGRYAVWLRTEAFRLQPDSLAIGAFTYSSRKGNNSGSFVDGDAQTHTVTYNGSKADEDWFSVEYLKPIRVRRISFRHGRSYHDGGWFDSSGGKPVVQVLSTPDSKWETVGRLESYPMTTPSIDAGLKDGQEFVLTISPLSVVGIRVLGRPSSGDRPNQNFSSCAELSGS